MKHLSLIVFLLLGSITAFSQTYNPVSFSYNGVLTNGVKIKTSLPFTNGSQMPAIYIEGYDYGSRSPIGLALTYYIYNGAFTNAGISSYGSFTPPVYLANEDNKVVIFISSKSYFLRFNVRVFSKGIQGETPAYFDGWTTADEAIDSGAAPQLLVPYKNAFTGNVSLPGNSIWNGNGKVGLGTLVPTAFLDIGYAQNNTLASVLARLPEGNTADSGTYLGVRAHATSPVNSNSFALEHRFYGNLNSAINFYRGSSFTGGFITFSTKDGTEKMRIDANGNVGIGTTSPGSYKLAVEGIVGARKVRVTPTAWSDFVFRKDYRLPSLQETEQFIRDNGHLPGIPGEQEVLQQGIDLGEMNARLLQKIEELTLHIIEMKKEIQTLKARPSTGK